MRTLCPNLNREDGLQTVLEVPIPEETFTMFPDNKNTNISTTTAWHNIKSWMKPQAERSSPRSSGASRNSTNIQLLLGVVGAPLIPLPVHSDHTVSSRNIKDHPIVSLHSTTNFVFYVIIVARSNRPLCINFDMQEAAMSKYIVQQYIAATGGQKAINSIDSMCVIGKVKMETSDFISGDTLGLSRDDNNKMTRGKNGGEMGGFVLWQQKRAELWCLELVVSGYKISAGSDGKVSWRQTPWNHSHASRGPPRPLRRSFQVKATSL